jgi:hypothetical protein
MGGLLTGGAKLQTPTPGKVSARTPGNSYNYSQLSWNEPCPTEFKGRTRRRRRFTEIFSPFSFWPTRKITANASADATAQLNLLFKPLCVEVYDNIFFAFLSISSALSIEPFV